MIGCDCGVCRSDDPRDRRFRSSIYVELPDGQRVLVDTTTDLRSQALQHDIRRVDAILFTHSHADHVMGLDEVRRFNMLSGQPMPVFGQASTLDDIRRMFSYIFTSRLPPGAGVPNLQLWSVAGPFCLGRQEVIPVPVCHGPWGVLGFRIGTFAYLTDCNRIPETSMTLLEGVETLVLDALRHRPHPTHFTLGQAIDVARRVGASRTYFTHMAHELGHAVVSARLPAGMSLAYDGLQLDC